MEGPVLTPIEYRFLVEHSPVMIWRSGIDAKCDYFNGPWLEFTGRSLEQEMGDGWSEGVHPDDLEWCVAHYLDHFLLRQPFEMEYRLRRHDGAYRWIFDRGVPFTDESGAFAGYIGSCVDVHERREAQETQRRRSAERLAMADEFERWILAIVSHDIRTPLGTIKMIAAALRLDGELRDETRRWLDALDGAVERIGYIVGDLLDLSRERQGSGIRIDLKPIDLRAICERIVEELGATARDRRIELECDADGATLGDEHRILQAVSNVASNAVQHSPPGTPVRLRLTGDERRMTIEVRNEGTVSEDLRPRLFEPFSPARRHRQRGEGLGLGLFIARAIARAHGGDLEAECSDHDTTFRLLLPGREAALHARGGSWPPPYAPDMSRIPRRQAPGRGSSV